MFEANLFKGLIQQFVIATKINNFLYTEALPPEVSLVFR